MTKPGTKGIEPTSRPAATTNPTRPPGPGLRSHLAPMSTSRCRTRASVETQRTGQLELIRCPLDRFRMVSHVLRISGSGFEAHTRRYIPKKNRDSCAWLNYILCKALEKRASGRHGLRRSGRSPAGDAPAYLPFDRSAGPLFVPLQGRNNGACTAHQCRAALTRLAAATPRGDAHALS
jgi:hypothetical protein